MPHTPSLKWCSHPSESKLSPPLASAFCDRSTPLIPQRGPGFRGWARNLLIHDRAYNQRSNAESVFFGWRQRYGETLWARTWFGQFRGLVMKSAVRNIERVIEGPHRW